MKVGDKVVAVAKDHCPLSGPIGPEPGSVWAVVGVMSWGVAIGVSDRSRADWWMPWRFVAPAGVRAPGCDCNHCMALVREEIAKAEAEQSWFAADLSSTPPRKFISANYIFVNTDATRQMEREFASLEWGGCRHERWDENAAGKHCVACKEKLP